MADCDFVAALHPSAPDDWGKKCDLHRIDTFFFSATEQVDWKKWVAQQARRYLADHGIRAAGRELADLDGIATDNGRNPLDLVNQYQREFATPMLRDTSTPEEEEDLKYRVREIFLEAYGLRVPALPCTDVRTSIRSEIRRWIAQWGIMRDNPDYQPHMTEEAMRFDTEAIPDQAIPTDENE